MITVLHFKEIESDLAGNILAHTPIPWTETFRECEDLAAAHTEKLGVRSIDLLHVGLALTLHATEFLTHDERQASLAKAAGLRVKPEASLPASPMARKDVTSG